MKAFLLEIGLSQNESSIYLELLKLGPQLVSTIAKRLDLKRPTVYTSLKSLISKGVVAVFKKGGLNYFSANDPNSLVAFLDSKSRVFEYYKTQTLSLIPNLRKLSEEFACDRTKVVLYDGSEAMNNLLLLEAKNSPFIYSFFPLHYSVEPILDRFLLETDELFSELFDLEVKVLVNNTSLNKIVASRLLCFSHQNKSCKFFDSDMKFFDSSAFVNIYKDKVVLFNLKKGLENAVSINSKSFANLLKTLFTYFWNLNK